MYRQHPTGRQPVFKYENHTLCGVQIGFNSLFYLECSSCWRVHCSNCAIERCVQQCPVLPPVYSIISNSNFSEGDKIWLCFLTWNELGNKSSFIQIYCRLAPPDASCCGCNCLYYQKRSSTKVRSSKQIPIFCAHARHNCKDTSTWRMKHNWTSFVVDPYRTYKPQ